MVLPGSAASFKNVTITLAKKKDLDIPPNNDEKLGSSEVQFNNRRI